MTASKLNESQNRYKVIFENHVDTKTRHVFNHYLWRDIQTLRERVKNGTESKEDLSLKWLLLKYKFPREMREFIANFIYNDNDIDYSLLEPNIYFVDEASEIAVSDKATSRRKWQELQKRSDIQKLYATAGERKLVIDGAVTLEELRSFLTRHWKDIRKSLVDVSPNVNYVSSRGVGTHSTAKRDYRVVQLAEEGYSYVDINNILAKEFPGYSVTYKVIDKLKTKIANYRDDDYEI